MTATPAQMERYCPDCGLMLPSEAEGAGCPHCLFRLAMGEEPGAGPALAQPTSLPGLRSRFLGDYEILSELARGGMGIVYRARQISLNRTVALKMLQPGQLDSPEAWLRFQTEIRASAQLSHPNIVSLHESGTAEGLHFFTMRLLEGGSLAARLAGARRTADGAAPTREDQVMLARMLSKVARAVHYAHQHGVLHRDLKPSNILLDEHGEPHVADFGLAKILTQESAATLTDSILGSPNYMAPEQADSRSKQITVHTDVYGLGTILYEVLTGVPPFQASTPVETIRKVLDEDPVPPRRLNPAMDVDLETICLKCLQKNPAGRYSSAEDLASDLDRWAQGLPILARPVGPFGLLVRWARRRPALAALSGVLLLTVVAGAVGGSVAVVRIRKAEQAAVERLRESLLDQARVLRANQAAGGRTESRQLLRQAAALGGTQEFRERMRDEALATLGLPQVEFTPVAGVQVEGSMRALMDPAMRRLARIIEGTNIVLSLTQGGTPPRTVGRAEPGSHLEAFSPDGRYLAVRHSSRVDFLEVDSGQVMFSTETRTRVFCFASHAPLAALEEAECEVSLWDLTAGRELRRLTLRPDPPGNRGRGFLVMSLSPDGRLLACSRAADNTIELVEVETGKTLWRATMEAPMVALAWQPSRGRLVSAGRDGRIVALRLSDGVAAFGFYSASGAISLALHDGASLLAAACRDRRVRVWDLSALRLQFEAECEGRNLTFDDQAARLATVLRGERVGWLTFEPSPEYKETVVAPTTRQLHECAFSADGKTIVIGYPTRIHLFDAADYSARGSVVVGELPVMALDPQGEFLLTADGNGVSARALPGSRFQSRMAIPGPRWRALALSADGSRVWAANTWSNTVYALSRDFVPTGMALGPHDFVDAVAVSPDGRWVASGSSLLLTVKMWDVQARKEVATLQAGRFHRMSFSADGRWLAIGGDQFDLRRVGSWEPAPPLPYPGERPVLSAATFSPDGRVLAVVEEQDQVRLFDLVTWKSLGLLRTPGIGSLNSLSFSPSTRRLAAVGGSGRLRTWDLTAIRRELESLGLEWQFPFPTLEAEAGSAREGR